MVLTSCLSDRADYIHLCLVLLLFLILSVVLFGFVPSVSLFLITVPTNGSVLPFGIAHLWILFFALNFDCVALLTA